jgi:hypothetical protein
MEASERQQAEWFGRHGHSSTIDVLRTIVPAMLAADHVEALSWA